MLARSLLMTGAATAVQGVGLVVYPNRFHRGSVTFLKPLASSFVRRFRVSALFLSLRNVSLASNLSIISIRSNRAGGILIRGTGQIVYVTSRDGFGGSFFCGVTPVASISLIVASSNLSTTARRLFQRGGVPLILT